MTKAESNYEKNRSKILLDCPLKKDTEKSLDSAQYHTARTLTQLSMILRGTSKKFEYLGENKTEFENILTHCSVAQAGSNDEKTGGRKSRWTVPLRKPGDGTEDAAAGPTGRRRGRPLRKPGDGVKATPTCLASSNSPKCLGGGHTRAGPNGWWYRSRKTMKMLHGAARKQRPCGLVPRPEGELGVHQGRGPTISKRQCRQQMSCGCPATRGRRSHSSSGGVGLRDDRGSRGSACVVLHLITMH